MSLDRVHNILLVLSGKGGVGKSSVTTQLALSLSLAGRSVGILDIDLTGPSIPRLLGIEGETIKQAPGGWLPVEVHAAQRLDDAQDVTYPRPASQGREPEQQDQGQGQGQGQPEERGGRGGGSADEASAVRASAPPDPAFDPLQPQKAVGALHAMSLAFLLASRSSAIVWRGPKKTAMVRQFLSDVLWPELDYLLIDTPPGTSDEHISLVETLLKSVATAATTTTAQLGMAEQPAAAAAAGKSSGPNLAGAVVVTTPQAVAVSDVRKEINFCAKTGVRVVGVVENMSGYVCPCCGDEAKLFSKGGGRVMARDFGVPFLGEVPVDGLWGELVEEGKRPKYVAVERGGPKDEDEDEDEDEGDDALGDRDDGVGPLGDGQGNGEESAPRQREPGLLVDKYRNCSLSPLFADIAREVVAIVDGDTAVRVDPNAVRR